MRLTLARYNIKQIEKVLHSVDRTVSDALSGIYRYENDEKYDKPSLQDTFAGRVAATPELADVYLSVATKLGKAEILVRPLEGNPTGITEVQEHPEPKQTLLQVYDHTLAYIEEKFPAESVYRTAVENMTKARREIVEKSTSKEEIEEKVGSGLVEEIIIQAANEFRLAEVLAEHQVWEELEEKPLPDQWVAHAAQPEPVKFS